MSQQEEWDSKIIGCGTFTVTADGRPLGTFDNIIIDNAKEILVDVAPTRQAYRTWTEHGTR